MTRIVLAAIAIGFSCLLVLSIVTVIRIRRANFEMANVRKTRLVLLTLGRAHDEFVLQTGRHVNKQAELRNLSSFIVDALSVATLESDLKSVEVELLAFRDGWGRDLRVARAGEFRVELVSAGADGTFGTHDDLTTSLGPHWCLDKEN